MKRRNSHDSQLLHLSCERAKRDVPCADPCDATFLLPLELLELLFTFIRYHPRLGVVSLVCKRWRRAVLLSVTELNIESREEREERRETLMKSLYLFPKLTSTWALDVGCDFVVPLKLQELEVYYHRDCKKLCSTTRFLAAATGITSLNVATMRCDNAVQLVLHCRTSLTKLRLGDDMLPIFPYDAHFPALRILDLGNERVNDDGPYGFLGRHAAQLTEITSLEELPQDIEFLLVGGKGHGSGNRKPLNPLNFEGTVDELLEQGRPPSYYGCLDLDPFIEHSLQPKLCAFSNVTEIRLLLHGGSDICHPLEEIKTLSWASSLTQLSIEVEYGPQHWPLVSLGRLPALKFLTVIPRVTILWGELPCLRHLSLSFPRDRHFSFDDIFAYYEECLAAVAPTLRKLIVEKRQVYFVREDHLQRLLQFLRRCIAAGVEEVLLDATVRERLWDEDLAEFKWILVRRT